MPTKYSSAVSSGTSDEFSLTAEPSKVRVCGRSLAGIERSNPACGMDVSLMRVLCCQVEISETGRSLVQRSPTDYDGLL